MSKQRTRRRSSSSRRIESKTKSMRMGKMSMCRRRSRSSRSNRSSSSSSSSRKKSSEAEAAVVLTSFKWPHRIKVDKNRVPLRCSTGRGTKIVYVAKRTRYQTVRYPRISERHIFSVRF